MATKHKPVEAFDFTWGVPGEGYRWIRARGFFNAEEGRTLVRHDSRIEEEDRWYLTSGEGFEDSPRGESSAYQPLKITGLYREFAAVNEIDRGCVLEFANRRGRLGPGVARFLDVSLPDAPDVLTGRTGELHEDWVGEIQAMRHAVSLWDALFQRDRVALGESIRWEPRIPDTGTGFRRDPCWVYHGPGNYRQHILDAEDRTLYDGVLTAATLLLNNWINERLDKHATLRLFHDFQGQTSGAWARAHIQVRPRNLLGCLWLQLAWAVVGNRETRVCGGCGVWFEVSPQDGRTARRLFCTPQCKIRAHRHAQKKALRLHAEGRSAKEIAGLIGKDEATVRGWLPAQRRKTK